MSSINSCTIGIPNQINTFNSFVEKKEFTEAVSIAMEMRKVSEKVACLYTLLTAEAFESAQELLYALDQPQAREVAFSLQETNAPNASKLLAGIGYLV